MRMNPKPAFLALLGFGIVKIGMRRSVVDKLRKTSPTVSRHGERRGLKWRILHDDGVFYASILHPDRGWVDVGKNYTTADEAKSAIIAEIEFAATQP